MMIVKRAAACLCLLPVLLSLSGCWDMLEIMDLLMVTGLGIDVTEEGLYQVSMEVTEINASKDSNIKTRLLQTEEEDLLDGIFHILNTSGGNLHFSHCNLLIVGEDFAQKGIGFLIDFLLRSQQFHDKMEIAVVQDGTAADLMQCEARNEPILSTEIIKALQGQDAQLQPIKNVTVHSLNNHFSKKSSHAVVSTLCIQPEGEETSFALNGLALFNEDRLAGYMDPVDTLHYEIIMGGHGQPALYFTDPNDSENKMALKVFRSRHRYEPSVSNGEPVMTVYLTLTGKLLDMGQTTLSTSSLLNELERFFSETFTGEMEDLIHSIQTERGIDILKIGLAFQNAYPREYKAWASDWDAQFARMKITVVCDINIEHTGHLKDSNSYQKTQEEA